MDIVTDRLVIGSEVLYREAAYLDERRWDDWIALFASDCEYWVPTWRTEEVLAADPNTELSHIYYASRAGLEDRIVRIRSGKSPASTPLRRTTHIVGNVQLVTGENDALQMRSSWSVHVFDPHHKNAYTLFGYSLHTLRRVDDQWRIAKKKVVLQNDYLPAMVDIYCL
jgi:3-phenylpropionate/cinnamic acid dioxygenase small subunit